ncbi:MAG: HPF/RaiA family ribosome-associated protein [Ginsengibacter sp.]
MKINLKTLKFRAKKELKDFVNDKVSKLSRYDDKIISAEVTLQIDTAGVPENKICEIRLVVPGNDDFVSKNADTFEAAILDSVVTLQKVLQRKKKQSIKTFNTADPLL